MAWSNNLFYIVFLGQILLTSWYFPRRLLGRMQHVLDTYPPSQYPKLYPRPVEEYRMAQEQVLTQESKMSVQNLTVSRGGFPTGRRWAWKSIWRSRAVAPSPNFSPSALPLNSFLTVKARCGSQ